MNDKQLGIIINTLEMELLQSLVEKNEVISKRAAIRILEQALQNTEDEELYEIGKSLLLKLNTLSDIEFKEVI